MYSGKIVSFTCSETEPLVQTKAGLLRGYCVNGIYTFHGIRYATAERFQAPKPVEPWDGVVDAQDYGFVCPTRPETTTKGNLAFPKRYWPANEHCQYLNIWTKQLNPEAKKPVVVWLHGGGFSAGSCLELECYDGENMCKYGDCVQVSLNHRLNIYGFLDLSAYGEEYALSGNAGMEDIVVALTWIRDNIAAFGGDPANVTIFGESGGGGKVHTLMQMGAADGLYARAILDSGILSAGQVASAEEQKAEAQAFAAKIVEAAGGLSRLLTLSNEGLLAAMQAVSGSSLLRWGPVANTGSFVGDWRTAGFRKETLSVPMIVGSTFTELVPRPESICDKNALDEAQRYAALVEAYGEEGAPLIRDAFKKAYPGYNLYYASLIDCMVRRPTVQFCKTRVQAGSAPVYNFLFAHETPYRGGILATHADELAFAFHNVEFIGSQFAGEQTVKAQEELFQSFMAFSRVSNPNNAAIGPWQPMTADAAHCFVFDKASSDRVAHDEALMEIVVKYTKHAFPRFMKPMK